MPSRVIREGWLESETINQLDAQSERFFLRLCLRADDFGRYHANPMLLRSTLFPLRDDVKSQEINKWLAHCEAAGLLTCYNVGGKSYVEIPKFEQRMRAAVSKFPPPSDKCQTDARQMPANGQAYDRPPLSESESESESDNEAEGVVVFPDKLKTPEFAAKWAEYVAYRVTARMKPLKPPSVVKQLASMAAWGPTAAIASIDTTIRNGWQGLFEPKNGHGAPVHQKARINIA